MRSITLVDWPAVKDRVSLVNPEWVEIINTLPAIQRAPLLLARYQFGDRIVDKGQFFIPNEKGQLVSYHALDSSHPAKRWLDYSSIPLGFSLNRTCEVFIDFQRRIFPLNCIDPGQCFGLFETLGVAPQRNSIWSVCAGSRSLFMLPKIEDNKHFQRLKAKYGLNHSLPSGLETHGDLFKALVDAADTDWSCEILYFSHPWVKQNRQEWARFNNELYVMGWAQTEYLRQERAYTFLWEILAAAIVKSKLNPSPYQINTLKHLIAIYFGGYPGFSPATFDEYSAPIRFIQEAYLYDYDLKDNLPVIMEPAVLRKRLNQPVYYSLAYPTVSEGSHLKNPRGIKKDIQIIAKLSHLFNERLYEQDIDYYNTALAPFRFFHLEEEEGIHLFHELPRYDSAFDQIQAAYPSQLFPKYSPFARGCIQIHY